MKNVNGESTATVMVAVSPGRAPMTMPDTRPRSAAPTLQTLAMAVRP